MGIGHVSLAKVRGLMSAQPASILGAKLGVSSWPAALIGIVVIKAVLSIAVKPGSFVVSYSGIGYFLLLVLASWFAVQNGIQNTTAGRSFWGLLASAYGLWAAHQGLSLYYELGLRVEVPSNSIDDSLLFLHVAVLLAAVATHPHRTHDDKSYGTILNALLVMLFGLFAYGYAVFPYQYLFSSAGPFSYGLRFDLLYLLENLALVFTVAVLALRVKAPWKSIYLHLLGASILYALSSTIANLMIDSGGYVNGKLYGLGLTASVCWFVWIPLCARQAPGAEIKVARPEGNHGSQASVWAMLVVVMISIPIFWELFQRNESAGLRTLRMVFAVAMIICLASAAYIKEFLTKRELASHFGVANDRLRMATEAARSVGWDWDIKSGRDVWFGDLETMFGIPSTTYTGYVEDFRRRIHPQDRSTVWDAVNRAMKNRTSYSAEFRVVRTDGSIRWIAARGQFYFLPTGEPARMLGMATDITERKLAEEDKERFLSVFDYSAVGMALVANDGRWIRVNSALCEILGYSEQELLATNFQSLTHPDDLDADLSYAQKVFTGQLRVYHFEKRYIHKQGHVVWVTLTASAVPDASGKVSYGIAQVQDITAKKNAEAALRRDQAELQCLAGRLITIQEEERKRIARDLHDDLTQRLALLTVDLDMLRRSLPCDQEAVRELERMRRDVVELVADVRRLSHNEHHPQLALGLQHGVTSFCNDFSKQHGIAAKLVHEGDLKRIPETVCFTLFRVLQEAMSNVAKHSGADRVTVMVGVRGDQAVLRVADEGRGFEVGSDRGLGFISMRERLRLVGGTMRVNSAPQEGTSVEAVVPISTSGRGEIGSAWP